MFTILSLQFYLYQHDSTCTILLVLSTFYFLRTCRVHPVVPVLYPCSSVCPDSIMCTHTHTLYTRIGSLHVMYVELLHYVHCRSCRIQCCSRGIFSINFFPLLLLLTALKEFQHQFRWAAQWSKFFPWLLTCGTLYRDASISFLNSNKRCS